MSIDDSDLIERLHAVAESFEMAPASPVEDAWRGRRRLRRNRRLVAGAAAAAIAVVIGVTAAVGGQDRVEPAPIEQPEPNSEDIFADIHGWIVYGWDDGIWAVDPSGPHDQEPKLVTDRPGEPLGWASDGTKLLIGRIDGVDSGIDSEVDLVVVDDDGTENSVASGDWLLSGSISPDGSQVAYSEGCCDGKVYIVGTDGGTPRLLHAPAPRTHPGDDALRSPAAYYPVFSPDGTQIAFFDGHGDWGHRLRVMNADGTDVRTVTDNLNSGHIRGLDWSPDGRHLMFTAVNEALEGGDGIWVIGIDGSDLTRVAAGQSPASWSPDGSRISYQRAGHLYIANADGTQEASFSRHFMSPSFRRVTQWNPLPLEGGAE